MTVGILGQPPLLLYDVRDYGAAGDGSTTSDADYIGFQGAARDAIAAGGALYVPEPPVGWRFSDTVLLEPASGTSFSLDIVAHLGQKLILPTWAGDGKSLFKSRGWKRGTVSGMALGSSLLAGAHSRTVCWDLDADATYASTSNLRFENCQSDLRGGGTDHIGWRLGHSGDYDVSYVTWDTCRARGAVALGTKGEIGWSIEGQNATDQIWVNCEGLNLAKMVTNIPSSGGPALGSGSLFFFGGGSEYCGVVLEYARKWHPVAFYGGRHENGTTFLRLLNGAFPTLGVPISLHDTLIASMTADIQFDLQGAASLLLDNVSTDWSSGLRATPYNASFVTFNPGDANARSHLRVQGGMHGGSDPLHTVLSGAVTIDKSGTVFRDASMYTTSATANAPSRQDRRMLAEGLISESAHRMLYTSATLQTSGKLVGSLIGLKAGDVVSTLCVMQNAAGVGVTLARLGLFKKDGTLVASTANVAGQFNAGGATLQTVAVTVPYVVPVDDGYYVAFLAVGGTPPTLYRASSNAGNLVAVGAGVRPIVSQAGLADLPNPLVPAAGAEGYWFGVA